MNVKSGEFSSEYRLESCHKSDASRKIPFVALKGCCFKLLFERWEGTLPLGLNGLDLQHLVLTMDCPDGREPCGLAIHLAPEM